MGRRRTGGIRKPLYVECEKCKLRFEFWTDGSGYRREGVGKVSHMEDNRVPLTLIGRKREYPVDPMVYRLSEWIHGAGCGGKLVRLDIPDPLRKVMPDRRKLECGHDYRERQDMFGYVPGNRRACRECGKALRIQAVRDGKMEAWEAGL